MHPAPSTVQEAVHGLNALMNFIAIVLLLTTIEGMKRNAAGFYKLGTKLK